ncbi:Fe-S cluster assembly ATPase SufC [Candidatus Peregrinibacteria bacterium]|nr:Fe-S cluster assembly ATPase SufC [Candidatus Peregrinibacteria bacterium]
MLCERIHGCRIRLRLSEINTEIESTLQGINLEYFLTERLEEKNTALPKKIKKPYILKIENLHAGLAEKNILRRMNLTIKSGEIHALMGPNGSGKSTLCSVIMGHPAYHIQKGSLLLNGKNIKNLPVNERANRGIFLGFQSPSEISGVRMENFLRLAKNTGIKSLKGKTRLCGPREFHEFFEKHLSDLKMPQTFSERDLNEGFSGGEKKRGEILQMAILEPKIVLLDEIDSGLDIDGLRIVAENIKKFQRETGAGILIITHYQRIFEYIEPDFVHVMKDGRIIRSGGRDLARELEKSGYEQ